MEDDHVDRPGVEERQRLKLTGTNSSIGLIVLIPYAHLTKSMDCSHSRLFRPSGGAAEARRISARRPVDLAKLRSERRQDCKERPIGTENSFSNNVRFADLVVMAERLHPIPFRTRP